MQRRHFNAAALIGCSTLLSAPLARAQAPYPNKPVKFFVPYVAGGQPDTVARVVSPKLGERLGQPVVVDNRPGAAGSSAFNAMQQVRPADGHAFMVTDGSILSVSPLINAAVSNKLDKDFVPVSLIGRSTLFLLTHPKTGIKTLQEFVSAVRQKPGEYTYASAGIGSVHHLTMESFTAALNLNIRHVPYRGTGQSTPALVAGQVDFSIAALPSVAGFIQSGHLRLLGTSSTTRSPQTPDVPAMSDLVPHFDIAPLMIVLAPPGTPEAAISRVASEIAESVKAPDVIRGLHAADVTPVGAGPAELRRQLEREFEVMAKAVKLAKLKPE